MTKPRQETEALHVSEVEHRTANCFQMLISLTRMQLAQCESEEAQERVACVLDTILTLAQMQSCLRQAGDRGIGLYLRDAERLWRRLGASKGIAVQLEGDELPELPASTANNLALILQEATSNAFEHAFPEGRKGSVRVAVVRAHEDHARLLVEDDGIGLSETAGKPEGHGSHLIQALARGANGSAAWEPRRNGGTCLRVEFPIPRQQGGPRRTQHG